MIGGKVSLLGTVLIAKCLAYWQMVKIQIRISFRDKRIIQNKTFFFKLTKRVRTFRQTNISVHIGHEVELNGNEKLHKYLSTEHKDDSYTNHCWNLWNNSKEPEKEIEDKRKISTYHRTIWSARTLNSPGWVSSWCNG